MLLRCERVMLLPLTHKKVSEIMEVSMQKAGFDATARAHH